MISNRSRNLGQLIKALHSTELQLSARINRSLAALGLNRSQLSTLACFSSQPNRSQTITSLAAAVDMNQPAVTKIVSYLVEREWLVTAADPSDARKRSLRITPQGLGVVIKAYGELTPTIDDAFTAFDDDDIQWLLAKLHQLSVRLR